MQIQPYYTAAAILTEQDGPFSADKQKVVQLLAAKMSKVRGGEAVKFVANISTVASL